MLFNDWNAGEHGVIGVSPSSDSLLDKKGARAALSFDLIQ